MLYDKIPSIVMLVNEQLGGHLNDLTEIEYAQDYMELAIGGAACFFTGTPLPLARAAFFVSAKYFEQYVSSYYHEDSTEGLLVEMFNVAVDSVAFSATSLGSTNIYTRNFLIDFGVYFSRGMIKVESKYLQTEDSGEYGRVSFDLGYSLDSFLEEYHNGDLENYHVYDGLSFAFMCMNEGVLFELLGNVIPDEYDRMFGSEGGT